MAEISGKVSVDSLVLRSHPSDVDTRATTDARDKDKDASAGSLAVFKETDASATARLDGMTSNPTSAGQARPSASGSDAVRQTQFRADNPIFIAQRDKAMQQQIISALRAGKDEIRLSLYPPQLGQVTINMALDGQKVKLGLKTANREATTLLTGERQTLAAALGHEGFTLEGFDVTDEQPKDHAPAEAPEYTGTVPPPNAADRSFSLDITI